MQKEKNLGFSQGIRRLPEMLKRRINSNMEDDDMLVTEVWEISRGDEWKKI